MQQSELVKKLMFSRLRILNNFGFYGLLLMQMKYGLDDTCETAYTDGKKICFDSKFLSKLSNDEVDFVMMHEILHVALKHCQRGLDYDEELFNIACDIVVNSNILYANSMNLKRISINGNPSMHLTPNDQEGYLYTAEEVYQMLLKEKGKRGKNNKSKAQPKTIDKHDQWGGLSDDEKAELEQMVNEAIELTSINKASGNIPGALLRTFNELKEPQVSWKELLNDLLSYELSDYSFSPPDRRYELDFFLPDFNEYDLTTKEIYCFVDTSGSITDDDLTTLISEINGVLEQYSGHIILKVLFFDTKVYEGKEVKEKDDIHQLIPKGYGGTSFISVFKYLNNLEEQPEGVIMLTDGYAKFPKEDYSKLYPVIWILTSDDVTPPWGRYARIKL